jgi:hypothetical protein
MRVRPAAHLCSQSRRLFAICVRLEGTRRSQDLCSVSNVHLAVSRLQRDTLVVFPVTFQALVAVTVA